MDEKKQIEEMANFLWKNTLIHTEDLCHDVAETLVVAGHRKQKKGEWLTDNYGMERSVCSVCGAVFEGDGGNYCPNCGAKMEGGAE